MSSTATQQIETAAPASKPWEWRSWAFDALVGSVLAAGCAVFIAAVRHAILEPGSLPILFLFGAFGLGAIRMQAYGNRVSLTIIPVIAAAYLYGSNGAVLVGLAAVVGSDLRSSNHLRIRLFNLGLLPLCAFIGAAVARPLANHPASSWPLLIVYGFVCAIALHAANAALVCVGVALHSRANPITVWRERFRWMVPQVVLLGQVGAAVAIAYRQIGAYEVVAFAIPVLAAQVAWHQYLAHTTRSVEDLRSKNSDLVQLAARLQAANEAVTQTYRGTLEALVGALDARDNEVQGHSYRVSAYSQLLAEELGIVRGSADWEAILRGALLHDVGKIGVQDAVLQKPGALTDLEWVEMRRHAEIGFGILKDVEFLRPAAALVRAHHEKFDGSGYPRGLKGEEIPLGARIFAVADTFDAITTDRPYRKAAPPEAAVAEIRRCAGTQFDPQVVAVFEVMWPQLWAIRAQAMTMVA